MSFHYAVTRECVGPAPSQRSDLLKLLTLPRLPALHLDTQHFSSSVIQMSHFPLQNKTTSNSLVLGLFITSAEKQPAVLCSFLPSQQSFSLLSLSQLLSEPQLHFLCGVEIKEGGC